VEVLEKKISRHPSAAWQNIEDRVLVVTPKTKKVHILDGCGACVWRHIAQPQTVESIVQMICLEYEVTMSQAQKDVEAFVSELEEKNMVSHSQGGTI